MPDEATNENAPEQDRDDLAPDAVVDQQVEETEDPAAVIKGALEKERLARKAAERDLKEVTRRLTALENAGKTDVERIAAERDAWQHKYESSSARVRDAVGRDRVAATASRLNASNPELVYRLVKAELEYDDDDEPTNVDALMTGIRRDYPELFKPQTPKADVRSGVLGTPAETTDWLRKAITSKR